MEGSSEEADEVEDGGIWKRQGGTQGKIEEKG